MNKRINDLNERIDDLERKMNKRIYDLGERIDDLEKNMNNRINNLDKKMDNLEKKLDSLFDLIRGNKTKRFKGNRKRFLRRKRHR